MSEGHSTVHYSTLQVTSNHHQPSSFSQLTYQPQPSFHFVYVTFNVRRVMIHTFMIEQCDSPSCLRWLLLALLACTTSIVRHIPILDETQPTSHT